MSIDRKVKLGIIGTGWWANTMHMPALVNCEQANVVACCGRNPERTAAFAKKWNIPHYYTDYKEMLARGLSLSMMTLMLALAFGSAAWGAVATRFSVPAAIAAAGLVAVAWPALRLLRDAARPAT